MSSFAVRRAESLQNKRKVSSLSDRSDTSEPGQEVSGEESPGMLSDDQPPESPTDTNDTDETATLPWLKVCCPLSNIKYVDWKYNDDLIAIYISELNSLECSQKPDEFTTSK